MGKLFGVFTLTVKPDGLQAGQTATLAKLFVVPGCKHGFIAVRLVVLTYELIRTSASTHHRRNCSLWDFYLALFFSFSPWKLQLCSNFHTHSREDQFSDWNFHLVFLVQPCYLLRNQSWSYHLFNLNSSLILLLNCDPNLPTNFQARKNTKL